MESASTIVKPDIEVALPLVTVPAGLTVLVSLSGLAWAGDVYDWSTAAGSNTFDPPDGFPAAGNPADIDDAAREVMAAMRRWQYDSQPSQLSTGTAEAYALAATQTISSYITGMQFGFFASFAATGSSIHASPHFVHTNAGTPLTTTTPNFKSTANVVVPGCFSPPQRGHGCVTEGVSFLQGEADG